MNELEHLSEAQRWKLMVNAATRAAESVGYRLTKVPGRGLSNIYTVKKDGVEQRACVRTTRDRWIAFPPLAGGTKWKTLDDVDLVIVATVDSKDEPTQVEVYIFPVAEVRKRFDRAYTARREQGNVVRDNFGMWVGLDIDKRAGVYSWGSGIAEKMKDSRIAVYPLEDLVRQALEQSPTNEEQASDGDIGEKPGTEPKTIADVMAWARERVAALAGVRLDAVKLDLKVEY